MTEAQPAEEQQPADENEDQESRRSGSFWRELPVLLGMAILVAIVVRVFVLQTFYIPSVSMENTLEVYDRVLVNKVVYDIRDPERGEIVVFQAPPEWRSNPTEKDFIKRVIAVGGDHIECCDSQQRLVVNGEPLDEPYLYSSDGVADDAAATHFDIVVPEGRLWMMGDHRNASGDSMDQYQRSGGDLEAATISRAAVIGRAFLLFWPLDRATVLSVPDTFDPVPGSPPERAEPDPAG